MKTTDSHVTATSQQAANRAGDEIPTIEEFIKLRRDTSGVRLIFSLVEYALGLDLPDDVIEDLIIEELVDCANDISEYRCWTALILY